MKNFLDKFTKSIQSDKKGHFLAGVFIVVVLSSLFSFLQKPYSVGIVVSIIGVQGFALGKEVYDSFFPKSHTTDFNDYTATVAGGFLVLSILAILSSL